METTSAKVYSGVDIDVVFGESYTNGRDVINGTMELGDGIAYIKLGGVCNPLAEIEGFLTCKNLWMLPWHSATAILDGSRTKTNEITKRIEFPIFTNVPDVSIWGGAKGFWYYRGLYCLAAITVFKCNSSGLKAAFQKYGNGKTFAASDTVWALAEVESVNGINPMSEIKPYRVEDVLAAHKAFPAGQPIKRAVIFNKIQEIVANRKYPIAGNNTARGHNQVTKVAKPSSQAISNTKVAPNNAPKAVKKSMFGLKPYKIEDFLAGHEAFVARHKNKFKKSTISNTALSVENKIPDLIDFDDDHTGEILAISEVIPYDSQEFFQIDLLSMALEPINSPVLQPTKVVQGVKSLKQDSVASAKVEKDENQGVLFFDRIVKYETDITDKALVQQFTVIVPFAGDKQAIPNLDDEHMSQGLTAVEGDQNEENEEKKTRPDHADRAKGEEKMDIAADQDVELEVEKEDGGTAGWTSEDERIQFSEDE